MATVYKRRELRPIPRGAEIVTFRGKRYAKWTNAKTGNMQRAPLNDEGTRIVQEAEFYTVQYFDENGKRRKAPTRCADKDSAQQIANGLEADVALRNRGIIDPTQERFATESRRSLKDHIADFRAALTAKGRTIKHVSETCRYVERIASGCDAKHLKDLTSTAVLRRIGDLRDEGISLRTCNAYLRAVKSFTRWLWRENEPPMTRWLRFRCSTKQPTDDTSDGS